MSDWQTQYEAFREQSASRDSSYVEGEEPELCEHCDHPAHGTESCDHDRTIHADGIEIDGPCGCKGVEICLKPSQTR